MRIPNLTANVLLTPLLADRLDKLVYVASEEGRQKKVLQVKITDLGISNTSADLQTHIDQFLSQPLNMSNWGIDDRIYVAKCLNQTQ